MTLHHARMRLVRSVIVLGLTALVAVPAWAQGSSVELDQLLFGHLDQHKTHCDSEGCGPTSVVNSFVYLQKYHAATSQLPKTPQPGPSIVTDFTENGLATLANLLGTLMGCDANCGTDNDKLYAGKKKYLENPGRTGGWVPKTDWNNAVTWKWITDTLMDGVDVELLVSDGTTSHYVTLTGYTWSDTNSNGKQDDGETTVGIIDPSDGTYSRQKLNVDTTGHMTLVGYDLDETTPAVPPVTISDGFSEKLVPSPVPEPGVWLMLGAGVLILGCRRFTHTMR